MLKIPFEDIVKKIVTDSGISEVKIKQKVDKKMEQLSGLISKEGAAHIIANELGVKLSAPIEQAPSSGPIKIKDITSDMKSVETAGKVQQVYEIRNFNSNGREGKVGSFLMADETGSTRVVLWNDQVSSMEGLKEGTIVKLVNAYAKDNRGRKELHINSRSEFTANPVGIKIGTLMEKPESVRKNIRDLAENDENVEIVGTIVQTFNIRFYEVCPNCNRRAKARGDDGFYCDEHARVTPNYSYVMNAILDDGSETVRAVFFKNQTERLLGKNEKEIGKYKENPDEFESMKNELIGNMVKLVGRVNKNEMFDRLEFVSGLVYTDINPEDEIKRLEKEMEVKGINFL